jgi:hypothetical protein
MDAINTFLDYLLMEKRMDNIVENMNGEKWDQFVNVFRAEILAHPSFPHMSVGTEQFGAKLDHALNDKETFAASFLEILKTFKKDTDKSYVCFYEKIIEMLIFFR